MATKVAERDEHMRAETPAAVKGGLINPTIGIEPLVVMTGASEATVTLANPTPPTNYSSTGGSPPNPATFDPTVYVQATTGDVHYPRPELAPYYDDGTAGSLTAVAANHAALAVGGPTVVPESTGTVVVVTAPGSVSTAPTQSISVEGSYTTTPNASHPSSGAPAVAPTITGLVPLAPVGNGGTTNLTVNGTGFKQNSIVTVGGVAMQTQYNSATQLMALNAPKRTSAGTTAVTVVTGGTAITASPAWTFS